MVMNKLIERIESGEPVSGVRMYYPTKEDYSVDGVAYISVKVKKLVSRGDDIRVLVAPVSGFGEFIVKPDRLIDESKDAAKRVENQAAAKEMKRQITHQTYVKDRKATLQEAYDKLTPAKKKKVQQELDARQIKSFEQAMNQSLDSFAAIVSRLTFDAGEE